MLTTLETVKTRVTLKADNTKDDALLTNAIKACSARFEKFCNRSFDRLEGATFEFPADAREINVDRYPIESIAGFQVKSDETIGWQDQDLPTFLIRKGCIISLLAPLGPSTSLARVTFTGGYVLPGTDAGAGQTALRDDIEQACVEQVAFWYQRRTQLGLVSITGDGGTLQFINLPLLKEVEGALKPHKRYNP